MKMATFTVSVMELVHANFVFALSDYPIWEPDYRATLNKKIVEHYMNYEIGYETEEMFNFALRRKMNEIMPFYNQLYKSSEIEFDPLQTINFLDETSSETENNSTTSNENVSKARGRAVNSETPQVHLSPDEDYATNATDTANDSSATGEGTAQATGTGTITHRMTGSQGHAATLLMQYRATMLNIDLMVISDLATLFMGVWNTNDSHTDQGRFYGYGFGYWSI